MKNFITIKDLSLKDIQKIFQLTTRLKKNKPEFYNSLRGEILGLIFQKPSNRTRVSFEVGMYELGGYSIYLRPDEIKLGIRESVGDVAKTLSRYLSCVVLRTYSHNDILEFARFSTVPVINGLTDLLHPCQALADIYTINEKLHTFKNKTLTYIGDGNNVCHSLVYACAKAGLNFVIATPKDYEPNRFVIKDGFSLFKKTNNKLIVVNDPVLAVRNADIIYTDVWASMGKEKEAKKRNKIFKNFKINTRLMKHAKQSCLFMHCLPAHRGIEVDDEVIDSKNSIVFDQAENRLHVQKAILIMLLGSD